MANSHLCFFLNFQYLRWRVFDSVNRLHNLFDKKFSIVCHLEYYTPIVVLPMTHWRTFLNEVLQNVFYWYERYSGTAWQIFIGIYVKKSQPIISTLARQIASESDHYNVDKKTCAVRRLRSKRNLNRFIFVGGANSDVKITERARSNNGWCAVMVS